MSENVSFDSTKFFFKLPYLRTTIEKIVNIIMHVYMYCVHISMNVKIYLRISISFDRILGGGKVSFDNKHDKSR